MANYSIFTLARNALNRHRDWPQAWRSPKPRPSYEIVIVGGGGHKHDDSTLGGRERDNDGRCQERGQQDTHNGPSLSPG